MKFARVSVSDDSQQVLFEVWSERPADQGAERWNHPHAIFVADDA